MLWYVLQTMTGGEEKLVGLIRKIVPGHLYGECFVVYQEQLWRRRQQNLVHVKRAFPGYVFITSKEPEALFFYLKQVPAMSRMMADDTSSFLSVEREEAEFLKQIMDERHVIGLSYLETDGKGKIRQVSGPLGTCISQIVRYRFGKRHVLVRLRLLGKEKTVLMGIVLTEDICRELKYGIVEAPAGIPGQYQVMGQAQAFRPEPEKEGSQSMLLPGASVMVVKGVLEGMFGRVYQVKHHLAAVGIHLFGQDMSIEMPLEDLRICKAMSEGRKT